MSAEQNRRIRWLEAAVHRLLRQHLEPCDRCGAQTLREPVEADGSLWYGCGGTCGVARYEEPLPKLETLSPPDQWECGDCGWFGPKCQTCPECGGSYVHHWKRWQGN